LGKNQPKKPQLLFHSLAQDSPKQRFSFSRLHLDSLARKICEGIVKETDFLASSSGSGKENQQKIRPISSHWAKDRNKQIFSGPIFEA